MSKKSFLLISLMLVLMSSTALADTVHWTNNDPTDNHWRRPDNWDLGRLPTAVTADDAMIDPPGGTTMPVFDGNDTNVEPIVLVSVGFETRAGTLTMSGGTLTTTCGLCLVKGADTGDGTVATVNMSGGTIYARGTKADGTPICYDGYMQVPRNNAVGTFNQSGGLVDISTLEIPQGLAANGTYNLDGGTLNIRRTEPNSTYGLFIGEMKNRTIKLTGIMNIEAGTMILEGDVEWLIDKYIDAYGPNEVLFPYPNKLGTERAIIVRDYDDRNDGKTTVTASKTTKLQAYAPDPIDGHKKVATSAVLRWTAGDGETQHDVYLSTDQTAVINKTAPKYDVDTINDPNYDPGGLSLGETYFWKVNEMTNGAGEGVVWSFTVVGKAKNPDPADGSTVELDPSMALTLSWDAGEKSQKHDVYYGTDYSAVNSATDPNTGVGKGRQTATTYTPSAPTLGQTYYWKINEANEAASPTTLVVGDVWDFTVADYLLIDDFESYANTAAIQSAWPAWNSTLGTGGIDRAELSETTNGDPVNNGVQAMKFIYDVLDDYSTVTKTFSSAQNWTNGSVKALSLWVRGNGLNKPLPDLFVELEDNSSNTSARLYHSDAQTVSTTEEWVIWDVNLGDFVSGSFTASSLQSVKKLAIGAGDARATSGVYFQDDSIFIDDIRLYPSRCVASKNGPAGDINGDCSVDNDDLQLVGADWLIGDSNSEPNGILTNFNTSTCWVGGKFGNCLKFDGVDDWVDIDDLALPDFRPATIAFWMKVDAIPIDGSEYVLGTAAKEYRVLTRVLGPNDVDIPGEAGKVVITLGDTSQRIAKSLAALTPSTWTHIAFVIQDSGDTVYGELYIDGNNDADTITGAIPPHTASELVGINIGSLNDGDKQWANAYIDDFRIYDTALGSSDVGLLSDVSLATNPASTPIIMYDMDESSGADEADQIGSISKVYHAIESDANIYNKEAPATSDTSNRFVNLNDYAEMAVSWMYATPDWP